MSRPVKHFPFASSPFLRLHLIVVSACVVLLCGPATTAQTTSLELDKSITRELGGGEEHSYELALEAGQYARVTAYQNRVNVRLVVFDSSNQMIADQDMYPIDDTELVSLIADKPDRYRIVVRASAKIAPRGTYDIKIKTLRPVTDKDRPAVEGERLMAEGSILIVQPSQDAWRKAIDKYTKAMELYKPAQEPAWEATGLYLIASIYTALREKEKAFEFAERSVALSESAIKVDGEEEKRLGIKVKAIALTILGQVHGEFGDRKKALALYQQALALNRQIKERIKEYDCLNLIAYVFQQMGDFREALDHLKQAREIMREVRDSNKEATLLNNLCVVVGNLGDYRSGIAFCKEALAIRREQKDEQNEAIVLNNLGIAYSNTGEYQNALDVYTRSHNIHKSFNHTTSVGITLNNIAWVYGTLGEPQKAIDVYNQAVEIFRKQRDEQREANALSNVAVNYALIKDYRKALDINLQLLPLRRKLTDREGEAITLNSLANCYSNLGEKQKALDLFSESLELVRTRSARQYALTLRSLGALHRELRDFEKALAYLNEGLQVTQTIGDRNGEAAALYQLAMLESDRGNLRDARTRIEAALNAIESLRVNVKSYHLRSSFFASVRDFQEFHIDLLMRLHKLHPTERFDVAAFQASEKGRARSLLELLKEAKVEIRQGVDQVLVERERTLRTTIANKSEAQTRLLSSANSSEQAAAAAKEIESLTNEYEQVQSQIRQTSPRFAALTQPQPLGLNEIQSTLLSADTVLVEFSLGERQSFVWVVTPSSVKSFELPKRAEIDVAARSYYDQLTAPRQSGATALPAGESLSRLLLSPIAHELKNKRLLVVGEGILQYVPFSALPDPNKNFVQPLVVAHEIVNLPSASVLSSLRSEAANRPKPTKTVAIFADPVFDNRDPRLSMVRKVKFDDTDSSVRDQSTSNFVRLRFTRQEADEIARLIPGNQSVKELDFAASRVKALSSDLGQYRMVHFASHGLVNNQHAELSGIVLSLVDETGQPQNGFLRIYDIYNMNLNADLVVLSACQTGLGKDIKGEGLVGLTRAFMYAGTTRVVASLWQTEDRGTAELMGRFYEGMLVDQLSPAAALRKAQVAMWQNKRWQDPRYWAAFTLQGEWK